MGWTRRAVATWTAALTLSLWIAAPSATAQDAAPAPDDAPATSSSPDPLAEAAARSRAALGGAPSDGSPPSDEPVAGGQLTEGPSVSLTELLEHARQSAPRMRVARARAERWRPDRAAASIPVPSDPSVQAGAGPRFVSGGTGVDAQVQLRQELEVAGEQGARARVADRARQTHDAALELAWFELHHAIHRAYHRALIDRERVQLAEALVRAQRDVTAVVHRRVALGEDSPLEAQLAETELARARQILSRQRQDYLGARHRLVELSGWPARPLPVPVGELEEPRRAPPLETLVRIALRSGPQLAVRRAAVAEARARRDLADREAWPRLTVGLNYEVEGGGLGDEEEHQVLGVLGFVLPFWHRNQVDRSRAEIALDVAEAQQHAMEFILEGHVARLAATLDAAGERVRRHRRELVPNLTLRAQQLRRAYELGEIDVLRFATAHERLLQARLTALEAHQAYFDAVTALEDAIGADPWPHTHEADPTP